MGWLSDAWDSAKDAVSDVWSGAKDAIKDVTGVDSINTLLATGGLAMVPANLSGKGVLGEALTQAMNPMLQPYGQGPAPSAMTGPLTQPAPSNLTFGAGASPAASSRTAPQDLASYLGGSGYDFSGGSTSAALLRSNPDAYKFAPLVSTIS